MEISNHKMAATTITVNTKSDISLVLNWLLIVSNILMDIFSKPVEILHYKVYLI